MKIKHAFATLIGMLVAIIIIFILSIIMLNSFFKQTTREQKLGQELNKSLKEQNIKASSSPGTYEALVEDAQTTVDDINRKYREQEKEIEGLEW